MIYRLLRAVERDPDTRALLEPLMDHRELHKVKSGTFDQHSAQTLAYVGLWVSSAVLHQTFVYFLAFCIPQNTYFAAHGHLEVRTPSSYPKNLFFSPGIFEQCPLKHLATKPKADGKMTTFATLVITLFSSIFHIYKKNVMEFSEVFAFAQSWASTLANRSNARHRSNIRAPTPAPPPKFMYSKCGNLCGQRGWKRFIAI